MISLVIPTIQGREKMLNKTIGALQSTTCDELEFVIPKGHQTIGDGWNAGARVANGDFLMLTADDMIPHDGWCEAAIQAADSGVYPAPWIVREDGTTECCGTLGSGLLLNENTKDGALVCNSPAPFMRYEHWDEIGPSIRAHYYSDDYLAYRARVAGLEVRFVRDYKFTHLDGRPGHLSVVERSGLDRAMYAEAVSNL